MYVHDFPALAPSVCFMCEQAEKGVRYVDTMLNFNTDAFASKLAGRKYICERCVRDYAETLSMFEDVRAKAEADVQEARDKVHELEDALDHYAGLDTALKALTKPKTSAKKAAAPAKEA